MMKDIIKTQIQQRVMELFWLSTGGYKGYVSKNQVNEMGEVYIFTTEIL